MNNSLHFERVPQMQSIFRFLTAIFVAIVIVFGFNNEAWGQNDPFFNVKSNQQILPGEFMSTPIALQSSNQSIVTADYVCHYSNISNQSEFQYLPLTPGYGNSIYQTTPSSFHLNWVDWDDNISLLWLTLGEISLVNSWEVGRIGQFTMSAEGDMVVSGEFYHFDVDSTSIIESIDGIRGDVNNDGEVTSEDAVLIQEYCFAPNGHPDWRYQQNGINVGRGISLFSSPVLLDCYLANIWRNDPNDPRVFNLGFGRLMSETAYGNSAVQPAPYSSSQVENELTVNTDGIAVAIFGNLPDGTPWQASGWTSSGQFNCQLPDGLQNMRIEASQIEGTTSIETPIEQPMAFSLEQNYPNPFNPTTTINFSLANQAQVKLTVYNMAGQKVATLADGMMPAGRNSVNFDATAMASGTYIYTLTSNGQTEAKKMVMMK